MAAIDTEDAYHELQPLISRFDLAIDDLTHVQQVITAMALRGIGYFREIYSIAPTAPHASAALLRTLVDLAILVRWIEQKPELRIRMWLADDDRDRLRTAAAHADMLESRQRPPNPGFAREAEAAMWREIEATRAAALAAKEHIPRKARSSVLPSVADRASTVPDSVEIHLIFGVFSQPLHSSGRAFVQDTFYRRFEGMHINAAPAFKGKAIHDLAVPAVCMLLASASRLLGLGLDGELDRLRVDLTTWADAE